MQSPEAKRRKLMDGKDRAEGASREQNPYLWQLALKSVDMEHHFT